MERRFFITKRNIINQIYRKFAQLRENSCYSGSSSFPIQTILAVADSHRIGCWGCWTYPVKAGITTGRESQRTEKVPARPAQRNVCTFFFGLHCKTRRRNCQALFLIQYLYTLLQHRVCHRPGRLEPGAAVLNHHRESQRRFLVSHKAHKPGMGL